jgi:aminopeptidase-like protein
MTTPLLDLVTELYPLHRTLVSDGTDDALARVGKWLGEDVDWAIERYPPGTPAWTWRVPARWVVNEAYLELESGERVLDWDESPLRLVSYSDPVDALLTFAELTPHLHTAPRRPSAIPWEFRYYQAGWGFCLSQEELDALPRDARYRAVIRSEQKTGPNDGLAVGVGGVGLTPGRDEILLCAHICHPMQANDDLAGVVTAAEVVRRLAHDPLPDESLGVRLLLCPETIGSVCYLSRNEELIPRLRAGIFCEMTGNDNGLALQRSRQDDHVRDRISRAVLTTHGYTREGAFRDVVGNDEIVINGPGVNIPCVSITRWPYPEYHTSDDCPAILSEGRLAEAADVVEEIVRVAASNYVPRRTFCGPVFLSGYDLWVDWRTNPELNHALEKVMLRLEGDRTVWDIAAELSLPYADVREHLERYREHGLIEALSRITGIPQV